MINQCPENVTGIVVAGQAQPTPEGNISIADTADPKPTDKDFHDNGEVDRLDNRW